MPSHISCQYLIFAQRTAQEKFNKFVATSRPDLANELIGNSCSNIGSSSFRIETVGKALNRDPAP